MDEFMKTGTDRPGRQGQDFEAIVAVSAEMQRARTLAQRAADLDLPILLEGEAGTGKRLFARAIHAAGPRNAGPFIALRFAGPSEPMFAATASPDPQSLGKAWEQARGGTLFLGNICEMSEDAQRELHMLLASQSSRRGADEDAIRLICASGRTLVEMVKSGRFDEKLYYQISVFPIWLPPLRARREDIPALAKAFLGQVIAEAGKPIERIEPAAEALLCDYSWPGNVRQLENTIFRAVALAEGYRLALRDFPQILAQTPGYRATAERESVALAAVAAPSPQRYEGPAMVGGTLPGDRVVTLTPIGADGRVGVPAMNENGEFRRLEEIEADVIRLALGHYRGHITEIARRLGIGRSTLYRKMREFGLSPRHN